MLAELTIVRDVGPVNLKDVLGMLRERLGEVSALPSANPGGKVLVASVDEARGRVFDVVFVPGLAEKLFPQRVVEDPLLSDERRELISADLDTQSRRVASERAALALAVGAARKRVVLSYPRFESDKARPRVPSFYALEAIRAAEGRLPGFADLSRRAAEASQTRMGWPAPQEAAQAIDDAEYDLSQLRQLLMGDSEKRERSRSLPTHREPAVATRAAIPSPALAPRVALRRWFGRAERAWRVTRWLLVTQACSNEALPSRRSKSMPRARTASI